MIEQTELQNNFAQIFEEYGDRILGYIRRRTNPDIAEDLLSETLVKAWKTFGNYTDLDRPGAWLYTIAKSVIYSETRRLKYQKRELTQVGQVPSFEDLSVTVSDLNPLIDSLSLPQRKALDAIYCRQLSSTEAGEELGIPDATVRSHRRRAVENLREQLLVDGEY